MSPLFSSIYFPLSDVFHHPLPPVYCFSTHQYPLLPPINARRHPSKELDISHSLKWQKNLNLKAVQLRVESSNSSSIVEQAKLIATELEMKRLLQELGQAGDVERKQKLKVQQKGIAPQSAVSNQKSLQHQVERKNGSMIEILLSQCQQYLYFFYFYPLLITSIFLSSRPISILSLSLSRPLIQLLYQQYLLLMSNQENQSHALFDISLSIGSVTNLSNQWTPKFQFKISFVATTSENQPSPYQLLHQFSTIDSTIDLTSYSSGAIILRPLQQRQINEVCLFRANVPLQQLEKSQVHCFVELIYSQQISTGIQLKFQSCFRLNNYLPIHFAIQGISIAGKLETQLIGVRSHKNFENQGIQTLLKAVECLLDQYKRVQKKYKEVDKNKDKSFCYQIQMKRQAQMIQKSQETEELYSKYDQIKSVKLARIFKQKQNRQVRAQLCNLIERINNDIGFNIKLKWQKYIQKTLQSTDLTKQVDVLRQNFIEDYSFQIRNRINRNGHLLRQFLVGNLKAHFSTFQIQRLLEQKTQSHNIKQQSLLISFSCKHVVVLVHGLGAHSSAMVLIQHEIRNLYPHCLILSSKSNQINQIANSIEQMGRNLAIEVESYLKSLENSEDFEISFVGHSLGGLVIRAALTHLESLKLNMNTYISLATPHLGYLNHSNKLTKIGLITLNKLERSQIIEELLLKDKQDYRLSYLYNLSTHSGFSWFKSVFMYGSDKDGYVSQHSALVRISQEEVRENMGNNDKKVAWQIGNNINGSINKRRIAKIRVNFLNSKDLYGFDITQFLIGRTSHLSFIANEQFIKCLLLNSYKSFVPSYAVLDHIN